MKSVKVYFMLKDFNPIRLQNMQLGWVSWFISFPLSGGRGKAMFSSQLFSKLTSFVSPLSIKFQKLW
jgi:hypothetical protein